MSNSIDSLLQEAEDRGTAVSSTAVTTTGGNAVAQRGTNRPPSLDDMLNSGMTVENWLKVKETGLIIKVENDQAVLENVNVSIDMPEVIATRAIKYGNPPTYHKTFDGVLCADGQTLWQDALEEGKRFGARDYASADIPMTLEEEVKARGGKTIMEVGQRLGYSLSTTNRDAFTKFLRDVNDADLRNAVVDVKLGYEPKTNKNKQTWGIVTFELLGEKAPSDTEA